MLGREHAIGHPALTDGLTGLANRLHFELVYSYLFEAGDRGVALTVMLLSVGGESAGDQERNHLRVLGERVQDTTRTSDLVSYLGHGRFVVLLLGTNLQGARIAADRVEVALEGVISDPVSIGLAMFHAEMKESSELLEAADRALRLAEEAGGGVELA
jgi:diguanylate cyclase (GGDEF)-like protein